jgi:DNA-binding HxlR family transcriptional regulator
MKKEKAKKKKRDKLLKEIFDMQDNIQDIELNKPEQDPLYFALNEIGGKWKIRVLWVLRSGQSLRYGEIKQEIPLITDMMLSQSLRELTKSGLTERRQYRQIPPKVEYQITEKGKELIPGVTLIWQWAYNQIEGEK